MGDLFLYLLNGLEYFYHCCHFLLEELLFLQCVALIPEQSCRPHCHHEQCIGHPHPLMVQASRFSTRFFAGRFCKVEHPPLP